MLGAQSLKDNVYIKTQKGYKPKKIKNQKQCFLQGIPSTGPTIEVRLIENFGNIKSIVNASVVELRKLKGIGEKNAKKIIDFFVE